MLMNGKFLNVTVNECVAEDKLKHNITSKEKWCLQWNSYADRDSCDYYNSPSEQRCPLISIICWNALFRQVGICTLNINIRAVARIRVSLHHDTLLWHTLHENLITVVFQLHLALYFVSINVYYKANAPFEK